MPVRLHINVDHVATVRNARGTRYPDPVLAAALCEAAGADGITARHREPQPGSIARRLVAGSPEYGRTSPAVGRARSRSLKGSTARGRVPA